MSLSREVVSLGKEHILQGTTTDCVSAVRFSPKECSFPLLGVAGWDGSCSVWRVAKEGADVVSQPAISTMDGSPILDLSFSPDMRCFFAGCSKTATMWDLQSNQKTVVASHDLPISCIQHVSIPQVMNSMLITGSWDGKMRCWDLRQQSPVKEENLGEPIFCLDGQRSVPMLAVGTGRLVHVYDMNSMQKFKQLPLPTVVKFGIRCISCAPQMDGVSIGSAEGRVSFIPLETGGCTFKTHVTSGSHFYIMHQTNFCNHHPTKPFSISGGGDGGISVINRQTKALVKSFPCQHSQMDQAIPISAGDLSPDGTILAYAHSYDWAMGKSGYKSQPTTVSIRSFNCA